MDSRSVSLMEIELYIDGDKKLFTAPFVPMLANRKYLEIQASAEKREETTSEDALKEDVEFCSILADIVFQKQFTVEQLISGASQEYVYEKLSEAIFGIKKEKGNEQGK